MSSYIKPEIIEEVTIDRRIVLAQGKPGGSPKCAVGECPGGSHASHFS